MRDDLNNNICIIISINSDIGLALAERYGEDGYKVIGTYRQATYNLWETQTQPQCYHLDLRNRGDITEFTNGIKNFGREWDTLIFCPCNPLPLEPFFESDFDEWSDSVHTNAIEQLRVLHGLYPYRAEKANVVFFAGGGVNNAVTNFSAYTISKIMLIKMCEYLDAENTDINFFTVAPGWVKTKVHKLILANLNAKDAKYQQTVDFLANGIGTSMEDIYNCIRWLCEQGKEVTGGRNFSVVNDKWGDTRLAEALRLIPDMYKLRRHDETI